MRCIAFAPSYGDEESVSRSGDKIVKRGGETALPGAQQEVQNIIKYFRGDYFFGEEATEQAFKENAPNYRLVHLAMHGSADVSNPMFSKLTFSQTPDSLEDQSLFAYEIFNLPLTADLVVLSACETGVGQFVHGEGVMSLAQGFLHTGVPAVTMSLWEAQDVSTAQIMDSYYHALSDGLPKDEALQQAKLEYLAAGTGFKHPFYWAAFVTIGEVSPLDIGWGSWWLYLLGALAVGGLLFFLLRKRGS